MLSESSGGESAAAVALHLERSYDLRLELDPDADDLPKIATEVGERLVEAGQEALRRSDVRSAVRFLERGLELVSDESPAKGHAFAGLTYAYRLGARWDLVRSYLQKGFAFADAASDKALDAYLTVSELQLRLHTEPDFTLQEFIQVASACLSVLERARRSTYRSRLRVALAWPYALQGQSQRAENLITAALREDGSHRDAEKLLPSVWLTGALRVEDAIGRCERLLAERPTPRTAASCYRSLAILHAMAEQFDEARELAKKDRDILEELGAPMLAVGASSIQGEIELLSGKPDAAANILRRGWHQLSELGGAIYLPGIAALLSRALLEQGRDEDAWLALEGADAASAKDVAYVVHLEGVRARLLGRRMADVDAVAAARRAVAAAAGTDSPDLRADASVDLGAVLATLGHRNEARHALEKAVKLYDEKGNAARSHPASDTAAERQRKARPPGRPGPAATPRAT